MALNGKWQKGQSGNPDGRPRKTPPQDQLLAGKFFTKKH